MLNPNSSHIPSLNPKQMPSHIPSPSPNPKPDAEPDRAIAARKDQQLNALDEQCAQQCPLVA